MDRLFVALGALLAGIGVAAGAFGAHGLRDRLSSEMLAIFETGVRYHLIHALALMITAWATTRWESGLIPVAGWLFVVGIVVFSGSLYALSLTETRWLGAITPIGGAAFVVGWILLAWAALRG
ncbi:MAG: DUF423 domain-containing protein [Candidatus Bipolaricaulia bacterium]